MRDLLFAIRVLSRNSGFTALAVCAIGFGTAAATLMFTLVNAALLQQLPYRDAEQLVMVWDQLPKLRLLEFPTSFGLFQDYRERNRSFDRLEAFVPVTATLQFTDRAERVGALRVTTGFLTLLGIPPLHGRDFQTGEDQRGAGPVALLSHGLWLRRFGGSPSALGQALQMDDRTYTIIGVLPPGFRFRLAGGVAPEVVAAVSLDADPKRERGSLRVLARLKPGVDINQARADMRSTATQIAAEYNVYRGPRGEDAGYTIGVIPLREQLFGNARQTLLLLFGATLVLLAITCVNVAHLFLEWRAKRGAEFAIREFMGASEWRIRRQLIVESLVVAFAGAIAGLLVVQLTLGILATRLPGELALIGVPSMDATVFAFAILVCTIAGIAFGLVRGKAHMAATRVTRQGMRPWLVAAQTALSVVLLIVALLLVRSLQKLEAVDAGFRRQGILTGQLSLPLSRYRERPQLKLYWDRVLEWSERQPEISAAALSNQPPMSGVTGGDPFSIEGRAYQQSDSNPQIAHYRKVTPGYFQLLEIRLLAGRLFTAADDNADNSVAIISKALAEGFFPNEDPLGKRIVMGAARPGARWLTIVGIVSDVKNSGLERKALPQIYEPLAQVPMHAMTLMLATRVPPERLAGQMEERFALFDRETPLYGVSTMEERVARLLEQPRFRMTLFSAFGLVAFLLALFGIYSVTAFRIAQRTREIGIRMAIGATPADIRRWVTASALRPVLAGITTGALLVLLFAGRLEGFLFAVSPRDALLYLAACLLFLAVAWLASGVPAWMASRKAPIVTLRHD